MANHGYLPHNGVATIAQFTQATQQVFGMGADLAVFLAVFGAVVDGDGSSWSIGGVPHTGIAGSHNNYETDSSPFKADLNQYGQTNLLVLSQFKEVRFRCIHSPSGAKADSLHTALRHAARRQHGQLQP